MVGPSVDVGSFTYRYKCIFGGKVTSLNSSDTVNFSGVCENCAIIFGQLVTRLQVLCVCVFVGVYMSGWECTTYLCA